MLNAIIAALHIFGAIIGIPAVFMRGRAMKQPFTKERLDAMLMADNFWGLASIIWIGTGLWRWLGGFDKGTQFYLHDHLFWAKMTLLGIVFLLELWPMTVFIKWRMQMAKGETPDTSKIGVFRKINFVEVHLAALMVFIATAMARGLGYHAG